MVETIAILTEKGVPSKDLKKDTLVNVFRVEDGKVFEYESIKLEDNDSEHFSHLLKLKEITLIYIEAVNNELRRLLNMLGIKIKCKEDWENDEFIGQFVFG